MTTKTVDSDFWSRLESRYTAPAGAVFLEDPRVMVRLPLVNGLGVTVNASFIATLLFVNGEIATAWTTVALALVFMLGAAYFAVTGRADRYILFVLWPNIVQNIAAHVLLGGFVWSGGMYFWGISVSVVAALFLGKKVGTMIAGAYVIGAIVLAFLEPALQARRSQPALVVSVVNAVDVSVGSVLILIPIVMALVSQITSERERSEGLLLNVLPGAIADRLKRDPGVIADEHPSCTVMFADIVGFTDHSTRVPPEQLIGELNRIFSRFDALVAECGAEKIKTMGDGYLAVAGAPNPLPDHADRMCELALRMQAVVPSINHELGSDFRLRVGLDTGKLVAGVVGTSRFSYDLWGATVNLASRMETMSPPGAIHVTEAVAKAAGDDFTFERYGVSEVKGVGPIGSCLLVGRTDVMASPGG
ncbi:MAG: adenylate/guanylate cyclase domain-containing protein [Acidimicrobiia bacterium]